MDMHLPKDEKRRLESEANNSRNPALEELIAMRHEFVQLRKDLEKYNKKLWLNVGSGVAIALILLSIISSLFNSMAEAQRKSDFDRRMEESTRKSQERLCKAMPELENCK